MRIGILGAGTWGIALARMLSNTGHRITVWSAIKSEIEQLSREYKHPNLPGMVIPEAVEFTNSIEAACENEMILFAVPSVFVRSTARCAKPYIQSQIIIDVAKGIEPDSLLTMSQVIIDELGDVPVVALSGPSHAEEVAKDIPTTIVSASKDRHAAELVQEVFMNTCMRVYTSPDVLGVELSGALKNIIALAVGVCTGLGFGDNTKAALITRGLAEITRLGVAMGCEPQTFSGLAGIGDLIVTATSVHSRNNRCGQMIGSGMDVEEAKKAVGMVVEGINALPAAVQLRDRYSVEMPIVMAVNAVINRGADSKSTVMALMTREKKTEYELLIPNRRNSGMKRVITYGTFDLLHYGHINLLKRAKALGDYLVVVISTDEFNWNEKHKKCYFTYEQRKALVEAVRYVDLVIPETCWEQKRTDIHEYHVDTFVMGDDWKGKFDFLKEEGVEVVYLPRTPEISSSQIKKDLYDANAVDGVSKVNHNEINTDPGK